LGQSRRCDDVFLRSPLLLQYIKVFILAAVEGSFLSVDMLMMMVSTLVLCLCFVPRYSAFMNAAQLLWWEIRNGAYTM
jgi:hypothetical protein